MCYGVRYPVTISYRYVVQPMKPGHPASNKSPFPQRGGTVLPSPYVATCVPLTCWRSRKERVDQSKEEENKNE